MIGTKSCGQGIDEAINIPSNISSTSTGNEAMRQAAVQGYYKSKKQKAKSKLCC